MKIKITLISVLMVLATGGLVFGEGQAGPDPAVATVTQENIAPNTQWVWGEVTSVDAPGKAVTLKYLDYETDQEKELLLTADESTVYENIKSLDEIKPKDNLSVDYTPENGKNMAKSINLERPDDSEAAAGQAEPVPAQAN